MPGYLVKRPSQFNIGKSRICTILRRKMPHRPKFDEPWMDELDGNNCVQKSVSLGVKAGMVGEYYVLDVQARTVHRGLYKKSAKLQNTRHTFT